MLESESKVEEKLENSLIFDPVLDQTVRFPQHILPKVAEALSQIGLPISIPAAEQDAPEHPPSPSAPILIFINSRSGGKIGPALITSVQKLVGVAQVQYLQTDEVVRPREKCSSSIISFSASRTTLFRL